MVDLSNQPCCESALKQNNKPAEDMDMDQQAAFDPDDDGPLNLPFGQLFFGYPVILPKRPDQDRENKGAFTGTGQTLRGKKLPAKKPAGN